MPSLAGYLVEAFGHAAAAFPGGLDAYAVAGLLLLAAYGAGRGSAAAWPRAASREPTAGGERIAFPTAVGLVLVAALVLALGLLGRFGAGTLAAGLALLQLPGLVAWLRSRRAPGAGEPAPGPDARPAFGKRIAVALGLAALTACLGTLALYPPLGFDADVYHLPMAKALVESHRLSFLPDLRYPIFPQLGEALYAAAMAFGDDRAARLLQLGVTLLAALAIHGWCERRGSARAGLWAAALWLGSSYVVLFGADAYVDTTVALFAILAVSAADRLRDRPSGSGRDLLAALAAGGFAGAAAATKYHGLFFVAAVPLAVLLWGGRRRVGLTAAAILAAALVAGPWYARIAHETGNPVFPYFERAFGENDWASHAAPAAPPRGGIGARLRSAALGDGGAWKSWVGPYPFNPWLAALAPAGLLLLRRPRRALPGLVLGLSYAPCLWLLVPEPRYLVPALPWACAACALGLDRLVGGAGSRWIAAPRWIAMALALALASPGLAFAAYRVGRQGPVPGSTEERERFLANRLPGYAAISYLDRELGADHTVYCLWGENVRYFARGRFLGDWFGPARYSRVTAAAARGPDALAAELRELGADHLVVVHRSGVAPPPRQAWEAFPALYEDAWARVYAVPVTATTPRAAPPPRRTPRAGRRSGSGRSAGGGG